jgi:hypothetical protein
MLQDELPSQERCSDIIHKDNECLTRNNGGQYYNPQIAVLIGRN